MKTPVGTPRCRFQEGSVKRSESILLVDDEQHFRFSASLALKMNGYTVTEAIDGLDAINKITEHSEADRPVDLLVTDIHMPVANGVDLIDALVERGLSIPTLVITGFMDERLLEELTSRGCFNFIEKPLTPEELVLRVDQMISAGSKE